MKQLENFFMPGSVAVVGASSNPAKSGYILLENIVNYGYKGDIFPINPSGGQALGKKIYTSFSEVGKKIDLAIMVIPNQAMESAVSDAAKCGVKNIIIISAGFGEESGPDGAGRTTRLQEIIRSSNIRVIGPNCLGIYDVLNQLNATNFPNLPKIKGNISFISQSGAYGGILFSALKERNIGLSKFISIGNQIDTGHADMLEYLGEDSTTAVIALFIEALKDGPRFLETARKVARKKPIVALKAGRTASGRCAAQSHTGSMAGEFSTYRAGFRQAGIILAEDSEQFMDMLSVLSLQHHILPPNNKVGIITISGGPAVSAADTCEESGIAVPALSEKTVKELRRYLPPFGAGNNPVDMTPQTAPENYLACMEAVCRDSDIGGLIALNVNLDFPEFGQALLKVQDKFKVPAVSVLIDNPKIEEMFGGRIPVFKTPERAVRAYKGLIAYRESRDRLIAKKTEARRKTIKVSGLSAKRRNCLTEHEAKMILKQCGIPVTRDILCKSRPEVLKAAEKIGYPVVLKVASQEILHKTDAGGVILSIANPIKLKEAFKELESKSPQWLVEEMVVDGQEIIIGGKRDETFGGVILFGMGGIFTEILKDFSLRICPVSRADAREMIDEVKSSPILKGYRGRKPANIDAIIDVIVKVSDLMHNNPEIRELDINPAIVNHKKLIVADSRMILDELRIKNNGQDMRAGI
ncbi:MAG: acetate--CoA ligase family protein [Planctomycetes bacterium]|nr:acetate--CoA ligase family protein [Planctomycetota bacterium]